MPTKKKKVEVASPKIKKGDPIVHQARNGLIIIWNGTKLLGVKPLPLRDLRNIIEQKKLSKVNKDKLLKSLEDLTKLPESQSVKIEPYVRGKEYTPGSKVVGPDGSIHILNPEKGWVRLS